MEVIDVRALIGKRALVTRQTAHLLENAVQQSVYRGSKELFVDFAGVDAISPSFVDELFFVISNAVASIDPDSIEVTFVHPPTPPSAAFLAIARAHQTELEETPDGSWRLRGTLRQRASA